MPICYCLSMTPRVATSEDLDGIVESLTFAFSGDPIWSWAFPEDEAQRRWWRFFAGSALRRYPWTFIAGDFAAVSVWIPPGGTELDGEEEEELRSLLEELTGPRADPVWQLLESFDQNHPSGPPHYYLSLLGVGLAHRGKGLGMALLAENLGRIDREGIPAFLESSNPGNNTRYERHGFRPVGGFERPDGEITVTTMWRDAPAGHPEGRS